MSQTKPSRPPINLPHRVIVRAPGLLPMLYKPAELAKALGIPDSTLRDWLEKGAPHHRNQNNLIWVNGPEFALWIKRSRQVKSAIKMGPTQAYCLHCNQPVEMMDPHIIKQTAKFRLISATCPICGTTVNRGGKHDQSN